MIATAIGFSVALQPPAPSSAALQPPARSSAALQPPARNSALQPSQQTTPMRAGTHVLGNWNAEGSWFHGVVTAVHGNGTFAVSYDDPDRGGSAVPIARLRLAFRPGTHVLGNWQDEGTWYHAVIVSDHGNNTFALAYDDPDRGGSAVPAERIKYAFNPGTEVEGNWQAAGTWYHAVILSDHGNNTFALAYDDPNRGGIAVPADRIRLPQADTASESTSTIAGAPIGPAAPTAAANHREGLGAGRMTNGTMEHHRQGQHHHRPRVRQGVWRE